MTHLQNISTYISRLTVSIALLLSATATSAQGKVFSEQKDTVPMFQGVALSFDLVGPAMLMLSDYGEYEGAVKVNLKNRYFPVVEIGYGKAEHDDEVTEIYYKTGAPYFRIGCDFNLLKNKKSANHLYAGFRYAFTSYKVDISRDAFPDPVWGWDTAFSVSGESCSQQWLEGIFGLDAKVYGPLHLGWNIRYKMRLAHKDGSVGNTWYIPGYGKYGDSRITANFNVIIDI